MKGRLHSQLRIRLTIWYVLILASILSVYVGLVFVFQSVSIKHQIYHDEVQDVETVEGLLFFDANGSLHLQQNYFSHPQSHLLIDRLMEVRDLSGVVLYRSQTLGGVALGGPSLPGEGQDTFKEHVERLADGTQVFLISHTHPVQGRMVLIRLGYNLAPFHERMRQFLGILLIALPASLVLAGFAGYVMANRALRPLARMADRAETITSSNLHDRLDVRGDPGDELDHMARVMNHLLERLEGAFMQLQRFTADVAHELRTPLAAIRGLGESALRSSAHDTEHYRETLGSMLEEAAILNQTIEDLLLLARAEATQPGIHQSTFSLLDLIHEIVNVLDVLAEERSITLERHLPTLEDGLVRADRSLIRAALINVLHNAVKFSPPHSTIQVTYARPLPGLAEICIQDQGPGIHPSERDQVFQRFFTSTVTETSSKAGSGLGLSIAKLAVERSDGRIFFAPSENDGARCIIQLSVVRAPITVENR